MMSSVIRPQKYVRPKRLNDSSNWLDGESKSGGRESAEPWRVSAMFRDSQKTVRVVRRQPHAVSGTTSRLSKPSVRTRSHVTPPIG